MVDIRKHQIIVISELSVDAVRPILILPNNTKQFMITVFLSSEYSLSQ